MLSTEALCLPVKPSWVKQRPGVQAKRLESCCLAPPQRRTAQAKEGSSRLLPKFLMLNPAAAESEKFQFEAVGGLAEACGALEGSCGAEAVG